MEADSARAEALGDSTIGICIVLMCSHCSVVVVVILVVVMVFVKWVCVGWGVGFVGHKSRCGEACGVGLSWGGCCGGTRCGWNCIGHEACGVVGCSSSCSGGICRGWAHVGFVWVNVSACVIVVDAHITTRIALVITEHVLREGPEIGEDDGMF